MSCLHDIVFGITKRFASGNHFATALNLLQQSLCYSKPDCLIANPKLMNDREALSGLGLSIKGLDSPQELELDLHPEYICLH